MYVCQCAHVCLKGRRWRWRWVTTLAVRLCEWDVRVPLVSECLAQVVTGRPTSLASQRKQRKMLRGKMPSLICKATAWHIRNLYAQLTTGRLIFPLSLSLNETEQSSQIEATLNAQHVYAGKAYLICTKHTNPSTRFMIYTLLYK